MINGLYLMYISMALRVWRCDNIHSTHKWWMWFKWWNEMYFVIFLYYLAVCLSVYYLIPFGRVIKLAKISMSDIFIWDLDLYKFCFHHFIGILKDFLNMVLLLLLPVLLVVTLVTLFEYVSELVDGGRNKFKDLWQTFWLFFAWKMFR